MNSPKDNRTKRSPFNLMPSDDPITNLPGAELLTDAARRRLQILNNKKFMRAEKSAIGRRLRRNRG